jgi:Fe-S cluster assembly ATP-binding protein
MIVVTHYQRLLDHIVPDFVHVLADGRIVASGDADLARKLEQEGYAWLEEGGIQPLPAESSARAAAESGA